MITFAVEKFSVSDKEIFITVDDMFTYNRLITRLDTDEDPSLESFISYMDESLTDYYLHEVNK